MSSLKYAPPPVSSATPSSGAAPAATCTALRGGVGVPGSGLSLPASSSSADDSAVPMDDSDVRSVVSLPPPGTMDVSGDGAPTRRRGAPTPLPDVEGLPPPAPHRCSGADDTSRCERWHGPWDVWALVCQLVCLRVALWRPVCPCPVPSLLPSPYPTAAAAAAAAAAGCSAHSTILPSPLTSSPCHSQRRARVKRRQSPGIV